MRHCTLLLTVFTLVLTSCSSNDLEDVRLTSRETLVERYGTLAPGTFRVRQPDVRFEVEGSDLFLSEIDKTLYLSKHELNAFEVGITSQVVVTSGHVGEVSWAGSYGGGPGGSRDCSGTLYVLESTPTLLRGVFAGSCGKVNPLRGPHDFTLVEGGFAYLR